MNQNDLTAGWIRARQRAVRRRVHQTVKQTVDGPLATPTHQLISDIPPGLGSVVAQLCAEVSGNDRPSSDVIAVGTAVAFVNLHLRIHAIATAEGDRNAILAGDLVRALADHSICRSSLSNETVESVSRACAAASERGIAAYYRTGNPATIDPSTFVAASRAGVALSNVDWLPSFVASASEPGVREPETVVPARFEGNSRIHLIEEIVSGNIP